MPKQHKYKKHLLRWTYRYDTMAKTACGLKLPVYSTTDNLTRITCKRCLATVYSVGCGPPIPQVPQ